jgi:hypothetical protein
MPKQQYSYTTDSGSIYVLTEHWSEVGKGVESNGVESKLVNITGVKRKDGQEKVLARAAYVSGETVNHLCDLVDADKSTNHVITEARRRQLRETGGYVVYIENLDDLELGMSGEINKRDPTF